VFDQTVREIKREVNKKVLKVPEIEVKILEATSNEPWGPHGTIMGDIAHATRNFNDYQMIMAVLYKRLNDTGRNWRHVYKALTVLEYLVANGADRVIDELREHTYQIQTLVDFQYLEPSGKDQGINVRKKAQTLVSLINDKEKIREVRQKASQNRDKYRGVSSTGMTHRSSSYSGSGGGYNDREEDRYGSGGSYGGSRGGRDEYDSYGKSTTSRDGDRYRDEDRSRDNGYDGNRDRDDGYGGKGGDRYDKYESGASSDRDRDRGYDDDDSYSRNGKARGGSTPPPAYEEAVQTDVHDDDRDDNRGVAAAVARAQSSQAQTTVSPPPDTSPPPGPNGGGSYFASQAADDDFDDFDPRGTFTATAPSASQPSESFFAEATPAAPVSAPPAPPTLAKSTTGLEDLFGDVSFDAVPSSAPSAANGAPPSQESADLFGDSFQVLPSATSDTFGSSAFQAPPASSTPDMFGGPAFQLAPPPPAPPAYQQPAAPPSTFGGESFQSFGASGQSNGSMAGNGMNGNMFGQAQSFSSFDPAPAGYAQPPPAANGLGFGGQQPFANNQPFGNSQHPSGNQSAFGGQQGHGNMNGNFSQPQQQQPAKKEFGPVKSAMWADTLSTGLIDLNIAGPKVNPLADLGIQLTDVALRNELWGDNKKQTEKKSTSTSGSGMGMGMGKAMGSGSGLGRAGASVLPPAMPPPSMMNVGRGAGGPAMPPPMGMGMAPQMGGMNFNMGMNMGMHPGMGVNPGMGMAPQMGMGMGMGMGMNQSMGMAPNMGMGGYPNQQYNGYR